MAIEVFVAVLFAAFMHAAWNAMIKLSLDRLTSMTLLSASISVLAAPFIFFVPFPDIKTWGFILTSILCCHCGYKVYLVKAYEIGDMNQVYPIARGSAPLMVSLISIFFLNEYLSPLAIMGIIILGLGICAMALSRGAIKQPGVVSAALMTALFITGYTLLDGLGSRGAPSISSYVAYLFFIDGIAMVAVYYFMRGPLRFSAIKKQLPIAFLGGSLSLLSYWIALWAMSREPIALVAALRESSILFALGLSVIFAKESINRWRMGSAIVIFIGIIAMKLG